MKKKEILIGGMSCGHCVKSIIKALERIDGITIDEVRIGTALIQIDESKVPDESLTQAIEKTGYQVISIQSR